MTVTYLKHKKISKTTDKVKWMQQMLRTMQILESFTNKSTNRSRITVVYIMQTKI